ncbi:hypothetical protein EVA_09735 [gut metagenome]|uniref:Uncharacterized protein n=1 Tax=gut metagenome TaxID=749906 RepID=J9G5M2_9ZZZZ
MKSRNNVLCRRLQQCNDFSNNFTLTLDSYESIQLVSTNIEAFLCISSFQSGNTIFSFILDQLSRCICCIAEHNGCSPFQATIKRRIILFQAFQSFVKKRIFNHHQFDVGLITRSSQCTGSSSIHSCGIYQVEMTIFLYCSSDLLNNRTFIFLSHYYSVLLDFFYCLRVNLDARTHRARKINTLNICTLGCGRFQLNQSRDKLLAFSRI